MKRKLPEPRDGWKDATGKTHKAHLDSITFHKTLSAILWQLMDTVHGQTNGGSTPTPRCVFGYLEYSSYDGGIYAKLYSHGVTTNGIELCARVSPFGLLEARL